MIRGQRGSASNANWRCQQQQQQRQPTVRRRKRTSSLRCCCAIDNHAGESSSSSGGGKSTRREVLLSGATATTAAAAAAAMAILSGAPAARALTLADVTPSLAPAAPLPPREQAVVDVFERATLSVVNVFDVALQGRAGNALDAEVPEGNGSGVVWDDEGNVVTNYHVLASSMAKLGVDKDGGAAAGAARGKRVAVVTVLTPGGERRTFDATLVGADRARDLAVVRVAAPKELLSPVALGDSAAVRVGQQVLAIGNPFGAFDHTLTLGIVSAVGRDIRAQTGGVISGGIQSDGAFFFFFSWGREEKAGRKNAPCVI